MLSRLGPALRQQKRQFHRIYRMKKEEHKYSVIPLLIFMGGMSGWHVYRHREHIINKIKNLCDDNV